MQSQRLLPTDWMISTFFFSTARCTDVEVEIIQRKKTHAKKYKLPCKSPADWNKLTSVKCWKDVFAWLVEFSAMLMMNDGCGCRMARASEKVQMKFPHRFHLLVLSLTWDFLRGGGWLMLDWQHLLIIQVDLGDAAVWSVQFFFVFFFVVHLHPSATTLGQGSANLLPAQVLAHLIGWMLLSHSYFWGQDVSVMLFNPFPSSNNNRVYFSNIFHHPWALQIPPDIHPPPSTSSSAARKHLLHIISQFMVLMVWLCFIKTFLPFIF